MSDAENEDPNANGKRTSALQLGPRKKAYVPLFAFSCHVTALTSHLCFTSCTAEPLVHHCRHFCRAVYAMCNIQALLTNGILREVEQGDTPDEDFTAEYVALRSSWFPIYIVLLVEENVASTQYLKN